MALAASVFFASLAGPSSSKDLDTEAVASCLYENASDTDIAAIEDLMVAAIEEDEALAGHILIFVSGVFAKATTRCGVPIASLASEEFNDAIKFYGEKVGAKIVQEALARIQ